MKSVNVPQIKNVEDNSQSSTQRFGFSFTDKRKRSLPLRFEEGEEGDRRKHPEREEYKRGIVDHLHEVILIHFFFLQQIRRTVRYCRSHSPQETRHLPSQLPPRRHADRYLELA
ncbi:hypothetical protein HMI54_013253 [Coelomomyces lativittatus]|nr:hypothetical protein HMI54_013253 [Coelomomyces lativittatus]